MPQTYAQWSYEGDTDESLEKRSQYPASDIAVERDTNPVAGIDSLTDGINPDIPLKETDQFSAVINGQFRTGQFRTLQIRRTGSLAPIQGARHDAQKNTLSLVVALQSTMQPNHATGRMPLVIPAEHKRRRATAETEHETQRLNLHMRHGLVVFASFCVLIFTMFTLTPLGSGETGIPIVDGAAQWVQTQQVSWHLSASLPIPPPAQPTPQPQQAAAPAPVQAPVTNNLNLPQSQYVAIAQADAVAYGISPVYFVNQIQQESGFNPYAESPVGAVGIAQFMPATAAGLGVNPYDPVSALNGAAQMMASLAKQYNGNYAMALAAYNAGAGNVNAAIAAGGANWLSYLPAETQNYVRIIMG
jgi:Transglycosylase SLT domain